MHALVKQSTEDIVGVEEVLDYLEVVLTFK